MTEKRLKLTAYQRRILALARKHLVVIVSKGYGRDSSTPNAVAARTFVKLVYRGLLTPRPDGQPYTGDVLHVEAGKRAWLTDAGRAALEEGSTK